MKMAEKIKIDIVSDVVCPWCVIGYKRLEKAIEEMGLKDQVEIEWQAFELNPTMPVEGQELQEHISQKYGSTIEQGKQSRAQLTQYAADLDFKFDFFDGMRMPNTREAHILIDYALENGKQTELNLRLISAHFGEHKDISDPQVLAQELQAVGLNAEEGLERLKDAKAREQIIAKEAYWQKLGVTAVPTMVFNKTTGITGAQPVDVYKKLITDLMGIQPSSQSNIQ